MKKTFPRRTFLKSAAVTGAAVALQPHDFSTGVLSLKPPMPGLQLWSVREDLAKDTAGTVKALAGMGYQKLEGFNLNEGKMFGMTVSEFIKLLKGNGLTMPSSHCMFKLADYDEAKKELGDSAKKAIDNAAALEIPYVIVPWVEVAERTEIARLVKVYQAAANYAKKAGVRLAYHNHDFEFTQRGPDNRLLIEWLLQEIDSSLIDFEMDIYWVAFSNYTPLDWFRLYPGRWKLCHVKDLANTTERETVEVGDGLIDFNAIFKQRDEAGFQHFIIELEHYKTTPLQGVKRAREGFLKLTF